MIVEQSQQNELYHQVWFRCMQMSKCTQQQAYLFVNEYSTLLNTSLTETGQTLIMLACSVSSLNMVQACLKYGANYNHQDQVKRTALHYASSIGCIDIFELLISHGAKYGCQTIGGQTPLAKACMFSQGDIIEWYLNNGIEIFEVADFCGKKPLDILRVNGEQLYQEVSQFYEQLKQNNSNMN